jgi:hypothetical protein
MPSIASRTVAPTTVGFSSLVSAVSSAAQQAPSTSGSGVSSLVSAVTQAKPSIDFAMGSPTPSNNTLRCSLPPIIAAPDNMRQFYRGGSIPQSRYLPIPPIV